MLHARVVAMTALLNRNIAEDLLDVPTTTGVAWFSAALTNDALTHGSLLYS
jgi:hypothetical protein